MPVSVHVGVPVSIDVPSTLAYGSTLGECAGGVTGIRIGIGTPIGNGGRVVQNATKCEKQAKRGKMY